MTATFSPLCCWDVGRGDYVNGSGWRQNEDHGHAQLRLEWRMTGRHVNAPPMVTWEWRSRASAVVPVMTSYDGSACQRSAHGYFEAHHVAIVDKLLGFSQTSRLCHSYNCSRVPVVDYTCLDVCWRIETALMTFSLLEKGKLGSAYGRQQTNFVGHCIKKLCRSHLTVPCSKLYKVSLLAWLLICQDIWSW